MSAEVEFAKDPAARPAVGVRVADQQTWGHAWEATQAHWKHISLHEGDRCNGFAMAYPRRFAAIYASNDAVWLQVGRRSWDAATIRRVDQVYERPTSVKYRLGLADQSSETIRLRMPAEAALSRVIDPTYDELESLSDDLMKIFPYVASDGWSALAGRDMTDWLANAKSMWASGIKHGP